MSFVSTVRLSSKEYILPAKYQRRHYTEIAGMLRDMLDDHDDLFQASVVSDLEKRFSTLFGADNPRFDADRFRDAIWQRLKSVHTLASKRKA